MPILTELVVSIIGGVATALILGVLVRPAEPAPQRTAPSRIGRFFGDLVHLLLAVGGGIALAMLLGRTLIQSGIMAKGLGGRLILLAGGTALIWFLILPLRRR